MLYIIITLLIIYTLFYILNNRTGINEHYNKIPYILFKTGPYDLPTYELEEIFNHNKIKLNIDKVFYFNDKECYNIIESMNYRVKNAYDSLIPTAYKADLWRYCVLYKYGGIYGDMTQKFYKNYDINYGNVDMVLVRDIDDEAIQISFIATKPRNNFINYVIYNITNDILLKKKGKNGLDITGPYAFCRYFKSFFNIISIPEGINELKGLDDQIYKIRIDMRQYKGLVFRNINTFKIMASTKTKNHNSTLVKVSKMPKYTQLYKMNKIYK